MRQFGILIFLGFFMGSVYAETLNVAPAITKEAWEDENKESSLFIYSNVELRGLAILLPDHRLVPTVEHSQKKEGKYHFIYFTGRKFKLPELKKFELHVETISKDTESSQREIFVFTSDRSQQEGFARSDSSPENSFVPYDISKAYAHQTPLGRDGRTLANEESRLFIERVNEIRRVEGRPSLTYTPGIAFPDNRSNQKFHSIEARFITGNYEGKRAIWTGHHVPEAVLEASKNGFIEILTNPAATQADIYFGPEGSNFVTR